MSGRGNQADKPSARAMDEAPAWLVEVVAGTPVPTFAIDARHRATH